MKKDFRAENAKKRRHLAEIAEDAEKRKQCRDRACPVRIKKKKKKDKIVNIDGVTWNFNFF